MLHVLQPLERGVTCETIVSGSSSMVLCARNAHITLNDLTTWRSGELSEPRQGYQLRELERCSYS